jgi:hypothetical protein
MLTAQFAPDRDPAVLKNWATPLYWQPTQAQQEQSSTPLATTANLPLGNNALVFVAMTPCRIADTRAAQGFSGAFGPPGLAPKKEQGKTFPIRSNTTCPVPSIAQAYSFNLTVVAPVPFGFITAYPTPGPRPLAATLNWAQSLIAGNAAIVPAGTSGSVDLYAYADTDLAIDIVIDINGYYAPPGDLSGNTALGIGALGNNTTGLFNTANGTSALQNNTTGSRNTATGDNALSGNTTGSYNSASGVLALASNTTGSSNTASGILALTSNTTGSYNTASGDAALSGNTTGIYNTASGTLALYGNITGSNNTAHGSSALSSNTTGDSNTGLGYEALQNNTAGNNNIALGVYAGFNITRSNNLDIGNQGSASDSGTIRVGDPAAHSSFFVAGVRGVTTSNNNAVNVVIDSNGQLGTVNSSRRFKEDIQDMGNASAKVMRLRPVTYRYKQPYFDGSRPLDYGLIAEEVAEIYPDLVVRNKDGQVETVQYQKLTPMLLNEVQKQHQHAEQQDETILQLREQNLKLEARLAALEALLSGKVAFTANAAQ